MEHKRPRIALSVFDIRYDDCLCN